jgi:membrane protein
MRRGFFATFRQAAHIWVTEQAAFLGAAIAYHTLFSIGPLLLIAIAITGQVYGEDQARREVTHNLAEPLGPETAKLIDEMIVSARKPMNNLLAMVIGTGLLLFTASNLFLQLKNGLQLLWKLPKSNHGTIFAFAKGYLLSFALILILGLALLVFLTGGTVVSALVVVYGDQLPGGPLVWSLGQFGVLILVLSLFFIFTFRFLSEGKIRYLHLVGGAFVTGLLLAVGKVAFGLYLVFMGPSLMSAFGAAGSLVIFLVWVYYSAQIVFFGAAYVKASMT